MKRVIINDSRIADFVADRIGTSPNRYNVASIGLERDGVLIAGVVYSDFNGNNITAAIAGDGKRWLTRDFLHFMFYYPFCQAHAQRITACIEARNTDSIRFVEHLGFTREATLAQAGKFGDLLVYRLFKTECRFLGVQNVALAA